MVGNALFGNDGYGVKAVGAPQRQVCGNLVFANRAGAATTGTDPSAPC